MASGIKELRTKLGMKQAQLAARLGVTASDVSKWERNWENPPPLLVKEMALIFGRTAAEVLGRDLDVESEWWSTPFAVIDMEQPYGTLELTFVGGAVREFPISERARSSIYHQMKSFEVMRDDRDGQPWLYAWSLSNRILYANPRFLKRFRLLSDAEEAMPVFAHPEVYRTLEGWDLIDDTMLPPLLAAACRHEIEVGGENPNAAEQSYQVLIVWADGEEEWRPLFADSSIGDLHSFELSTDNIPPSTLLEVRSDGYHASTFANLDHVAFVSVPADRYHRLCAPHPRDEEDEDWNENDGVPEEILERIEEQVDSAVNDNRVGPVDR